MTTMLARSAIFALALGALGTSGVAAPPGQDAPCRRLASLARSLPPSAWHGGFKALAPGLSLAGWNDKPSALEARLAALPAVKSALGDEDGGYKVFVQPVAPGMFLASDTQGTLECQSFVFLKVAPSGDAKIVPGPPAYTDQCWTDGGQAGRVFGQPAFVETSQLADPGSDMEQVALTPWLGGGWGGPCRLTLTYHIAFTLTERFCGDAGVCAAAAPLATGIAAAHAKAPADATFNFGPPPSADDQALVDRVGGAKPDEGGTPPFSTFGAKAKTAFDTYSYNDVDLFPLRLGGRTYVAAIGYGGVGWRMIGDSLLAVYSADGDQLKPLAGFVVVKSVTGLASAAVDRPKPVER
jgi:hypothetical protein